MKLTAELFEPLVGSDIILDLDDGTAFSLTLDKVTPAGEPEASSEEGGAPQHTAFALDLTGPRDPVIQAQTYPVTVPGLPPIHLFLSAHAQDQESTFYNIVVN